MAAYMVNAVIMPAITQRAAAVAFSDVQCSQLDTLWMKMVKRKTHMATSCPNTLVWAAEGLGVTRVRDAMDTAQIDDLLRRLDSPGILGSTARAQEEAAYRKLKGHRSVYTTYIASNERGRVYALHLAHRLRERDLRITLGDEMAPSAEAERVVIQDVVPPSRFGQLASPCDKFELVTIQDIAHCRGLRTPRLKRYSHITNRRTPARGASIWYQQLRQHWPQYAHHVKAMTDLAAGVGRGAAGLVMEFTVEHMQQKTMDADGHQYDWQEAANSIEGTIEIWTDGSVLNPQEEERTGGYAAIILPETSADNREPKPIAVATGRYAGPHCHSDMMEAMAIAHAVSCVSSDRKVQIFTDSKTCIKWWQHYVLDPLPWQASKRRSTPTYKIWEMIAKQISLRAGHVNIQWVKAHAGTHGNETADKAAKAAAEAEEVLPLWTLNNATPPVTRYDLLVSGVNLLLPPRKVLKEQSRAKHSTELRKYLVKRHAELDQRMPKIPGQILAPAGLISMIAEGTEMTPESMHRATRVREFALKLATGQLPTNIRQNRWYPERNPSAQCCRCLREEPETWRHIMECPANERDVHRESREEARKVAMKEIVKINEKRIMKEPPENVLTVGEAAYWAVPDRPANDTGYLLGLPDGTITKQLKELGLRQPERDTVIRAASAAALDATWANIWLPRCATTNEILGPWDQRQPVIQDRQQNMNPQ
jgi:ribonuclease HI